MDEGQWLARQHPQRQRAVVDCILLLSWVACVGICHALLRVATDLSWIRCLIAALPTGTLVFWAAVGIVYLWCNIADNPNRTR